MMRSTAEKTRNVASHWVPQRLGPAKGIRHLSVVLPVAADPEQRRVDARVDLSRHVVPATILGHASSNPTSGRLRNISATGGLLVDSAEPFPTKTNVVVGFEIPAYGSAVLKGRVARSSTSQMVVLLNVDEDERAFLRTFIRSALDPSQLSWIRIERLDENPDNAHSIETSLINTFVEVSADLDRDDLHQRFIAACLRLNRVDFAIQRYSSLKERHRDDPRLDRYLKQLGTILSFCALRPPPSESRRHSMRILGSTKFALALTSVAIAVLWVFLRRMTGVV